MHGGIRHWHSLCATHVKAQGICGDVEICKNTLKIFVGGTQDIKDLKAQTFGERICKWVMLGRVRRARGGGGGGGGGAYGCC